MKNYLKFLGKQSPKVRKISIDAIGKISRNELGNLDAKPIKGTNDCYRCRVGKIRIIFIRKSDGNVGDVYN